MCSISLNHLRVNVKLLFFVFLKTTWLFWRYCKFEMYFGVIPVLGPLRNIKELNNGREIMVIKYAEDLQAL